MHSGLLSTLQYSVSVPYSSTSQPLPTQQDDRSNTSAFDKCPPLKLASSCIVQKSNQSAPTVPPSYHIPSDGRGGLLGCLFSLRYSRLGLACHSWVNLTGDIPICRLPLKIFGLWATQSCKIWKESIPARPKRATKTHWVPGEPFHFPRDAMVLTASTGSSRKRHLKNSMWASISLSMTKNRTLESEPPKKKQNDARGVQSKRNKAEHVARRHGSCARAGASHERVPYRRDGHVLPTRRPC